MMMVLVTMAKMVWVHKPTNMPLWLGRKNFEFLLRLVKNILFYMYYYLPIFIYR